MENDNLRERKRTRFFIILAIVSILCAITYRTGRNVFDKPLGPTLPVFPSPTMWPEETDITETSTPLPDSALTPQFTSTVSPTATITPQPICGGPPQMIILAVGADNDFGYYRGLADVIRVIRADFITPSVSVLAFPRDLWVSIPGLEEWSITHGKVNQAYFYGNLYRLPGGGPLLLAQTLYDNFGMPTDRYIAANMTIIVEAIDAVGGVDIFLPKPLYDPDMDQYFPEGWNHFNGEEALLYSRMRSLDSDLGRIDRQTEVLKALRDKILQPEIFPSIPGLATSFMEDVLTDFSSAEIASLICLAANVDMESIHSYTIPEEMMTPAWADNGMWIWIPDEGQIRRYVYDFLNGNLP